MNACVVRQSALFVLALALASTSVLPARAAVPPDVVANAASADPNVAADALYAMGADQDANLDFKAALASYEACAARSPSNRWTPRAIVRASSLRGHAEGEFAPLVTLERVRRDPQRANDPAAIAALARDAEGFPPGLVRVEAEMLVAEAYLGRMNRPAEGLLELRQVVADPKADVLTSRQAARELVDTMASLGDLDGAARTATELGSKLDPKVVATISRRLHRRVAHRVALGDLAAFAVLALGSLALGWRRGALATVGRAMRRAAPFALAFAAYAGLVGGGLASSYETGNASPFLGIGVATLVIVLMARAWGAAGSQAMAARAARAVLSASSVLAAGFLILEQIDATYLEGFGL
jgi:hypothetical protein